MTLAELLAMLDDDRELVELLHEAGLFAAPLEREYHGDEAETARVAQVLVRELDVNVPGVEVILHMRRQILDLRRQMMVILQELSQQKR